MWTAAGGRTISDIDSVADVSAGDCPVDLPGVCNEAPDLPAAPAGPVHTVECPKCGRVAVPTGDITSDDILAVCGERDGQPIVDAVEYVRKVVAMNKAYRERSSLR